MIEEDLEIEDVDDESYYLRELSKLKKKLDIAVKALEEYADITNWCDGAFMCVYGGTSFADEESAEQALKEIKEIE